jgi:hypothetical protein
MGRRGRNLDVPGLWAFAGLAVAAAAVVTIIIGGLS